MALMVASTCLSSILTLVFAMLMPDSTDYQILANTCVLLVAGGVYLLALWRRDRHADAVGDNHMFASLVGASAPKRQDTEQQQLLPNRNKKATFGVPDDSEDTQP